MKIKCHFGDEIKCNQVKYLHLNGGSVIFHRQQLSSKCIYNAVRFYFYFSQVVYLYHWLRFWHNHRNPSTRLILSSLGSPCTSYREARTWEAGNSAPWGAFITELLPLSVLTTIAILISNKIIPDNYFLRKGKEQEVKRPCFELLCRNDLPYKKDSKVVIFESDGFLPPHCSSAHQAQK